jgi:hypothetical protein
MCGTSWHDVLFAVIAVPSWSLVSPGQQPMSGQTDWATIARACKETSRFII